MKPVGKQNWVTIFVFVFAVLCFIASNVTSDNMHNPALENENKTIFPTEIENVDDVTSVITLHLHTINENDNTLLFYTNHQEVYAYIDGELVYSLEKADSIFGRTPGAMWNTISLPVDTEVITIKFVQVYPDLARQDVKFELGNAINMYRQVMNNSVTELILTYAIIISGIALLAYWTLVFRKVNKQRELLYLGQFAVIFGIWNFGETQFALFMFDNRAFWSYFAFTCLMTMCLPALFFFREFMEANDKYIYKIVAFYIVAQTIICQFLHLTGIVGVKQTIFYTIFSIVLILVYLLVTIIRAIKNKTNIRKILVNIVGLVILVITAVVDISSYFSNLLTTVKVAKIGFLIYIVILGVETTRIARERMQEEQKMELIKEMAVKDLLTGCYNRNSYSEDVEAIADKAGICIIIFDLNDLKKCNDTRGHNAGDKYISDAAHIISDTFGEFGKVYRIGGDEFCIIARGISEEQILQKREEMKAEIARYRLECADHNFGIACGYAVYDAEKDRDFDAIRNRADINMYENKKEDKA